MAKNIGVLSILFTLITACVLGLISVNFFESYGLVVFVGIPWLIGFLPPFIVSRYRDLTKKEAYRLSFQTLGFACICLLIFAMEGIICIFMASPLLLILTLLGSYGGYLTQGDRLTNSTNIIIFILVSTPGMMSFDTINEPEGLIPVRTKIIIDADIQQVWKNVVVFPKIEEPTEWIFKTGIAYPTDATIVGKGVGAVRYCNFTTGAFVEPITTWDEPQLLQFDVKEQPIPMNEWNPFHDVHPPHLDGYFQSYKGQFKLTELADGQTELEGTTWYQVDIQPEFYWRLWSDNIVHQIHERVLTHIKKESER